MLVSFLFSIVAILGLNLGAWHAFQSLRAEDGHEGLGMCVDAFDPFARHVVVDYNPWGRNCSGYLPAVRMVLTRHGWEAAGWTAIRFRDLVTVESDPEECLHLFFRM